MRIRPAERRPADLASRAPFRRVPPRRVHGPGVRPGRRRTNMVQGQTVLAVTTAALTGDTRALQGTPAHSARPPVRRNPKTIAAPRQREPPSHQVVDNTVPHSASCAVNLTPLCPHFLAHTHPPRRDFAGGHQRGKRHNIGLMTSEYQRASVGFPRRFATVLARRVLEHDFVDGRLLVPGSSDDELVVGRDVAAQHRGRLLRLWKHSKGTIRKKETAAIQAPAL